MDQARGSVGRGNGTVSTPEDEVRRTDARALPGDGSGAADDLWMRIVALAKKEKISYLKATERCTEGFWDDYGLDKSP